MSGNQGTHPSGYFPGRTTRAENLYDTYVTTGFSRTVGNVTTAFSRHGNGVSKSEESFALNIPAVGASFDLGINSPAPGGATEWSVDVGLGKHLGVSLNYFHTQAEGREWKGLTFHAGYSTPTAPVGVGISGRAPGGPTGSFMCGKTAPYGC